MAEVLPFPSRFFEIDLSGNAAVLSLRGDTFMKNEAAEFELLLPRLAEQKVTRIVIDLGRCLYVSSEGLGAISGCWCVCLEEKKTRCAVVLPRTPESEVANLFEITGLARSIGSALQPTVKDALNYLREFV